MSNIKDSIGTTDEVGITIIRGKKEEKKPDYRQKNTLEVNKVTYGEVYYKNDTLGYRKEVHYGDNTPSSTKEIND